MNEEKLKIIYDALDSLDHNPAFKGMWKYVLNNEKSIEINLYVSNRTLKYQVDARTEFRQKQMAGLVDTYRLQNVLLIAGRIEAAAKEQLVANKIPYIEGNGNVFIPERDSFIWIDSNKPQAVKRPKLSRAFTRTGLKVVFHFLLNESFLRMSYRQIAIEAKTSLGNVTNIINALEALGFVEKPMDGSIKLKNKKQLLERWVDAYEHELKPVLEIGTFSFASEPDLQNWRRLPLEMKKTVWGGEPGAHLLTGMLKPTKLMLYTLENRSDLINHYRLVRNPAGNIKVYQKFWTYGDVKGNIAAPLLLYADLINSGDEKSMQAAERIFDDVLKDKINS